MRKIGTVIIIGLDSPVDKDDLKPQRLKQGSAGSPRVRPRGRLSGADGVSLPRETRH